MGSKRAPIFVRKFLLSVQRRAVAARGAALACALLTAWPAGTLAQGTHHGATFPVGIRELEYIDPHEGGRHLTLSVFHPAPGARRARQTGQGGVRNGARDRAGLRHG